MDADEIVARYRAGASMLALADRYGTSKNTIRKVLNAAGEPIRPTGRPRLKVSSEAIADLYEAGTSFTEIADRLGIHPDAARTRYHEIRAQRGLTRRNQWHQLDAWPPKGAQVKALYLRAGGRLSFDPRLLWDAVDERSHARRPLRA